MSGLLSVAVFRLLQGGAKTGFRIGAVRSDQEVRFRIRVPSWADETTVKAVGNGHDPQSGFPPALQDWEGGYIPVAGRWRTGDVIQVDIAMPARRSPNTAARTLAGNCATAPL